MSFSGLRSLVLLICAAFIAGSSATAFAQQGGDAKATDQQKNAEANKSEAVHIAEVARALTGPAAFPECIHLGELAVTLMMKNDLDTAFRHLDLYDRFGCPGAHIQTSFRCLLRAGMPGPKDSVTLDSLVRTCWTSPNAPPAAPATTSVVPAPATAGTGAH